MINRRKNPLKRWLPLIIVVTFVIVVLVWGDNFLRWARGEDILTALMADVGETVPTATPTSVPPTLPSLGTTSSEQAPTASSEIAPDGFPVQSRRHVLRYTVQPGDSLFLIADRFDLNPNTIFWANSATLQDNVHLLFVGVELYILPVDGVYHHSDGTLSVEQIAALYGVQPGDILYSEFNGFSGNDRSYVPPAGLNVVVPAGQRQYTSWQSPIRTGTESGSANPEGSIHPGSCRESYQGAGGTSLYINPMGATPYRVTNGFEPWHPGVDLAADRGTPIYASETGVVVFAGWHRDGYGELIIIDHGNGWTTYYGHLATRYVGCGDQVSKGQYIAGMGMSGNATGIHLHFEIRQDDVPLNPYGFFEIQDVRGGY